METISEDGWSEIIQFLDIQTITLILATSTTYNILLQQEHFWNILIQRDFTNEELNESKSPSIETYKYYYETFRAFPYCFPPDANVVFPDEFLLSKVLISSTVSSVMNMLLKLFSSGIWEESDNRPCIGVDFQILKLLPEKEHRMYRPHKIQWWISAGPERFKTITASYYRIASLIVTGFDIADPENRIEAQIGSDSLSDALHWVKEAETKKDESVPIYLIGIGKSGNIFTSPHVSQKDIIRHCNERNIHYFEVRKDTHIHDVINVLRCFNNLRMKDNPPDCDIVKLPPSTSTNRKCIIS
jgi:hypothetical protein